MKVTKDKLTVRNFTQNDIQAKINIINDPKNNQFLHYDIPLNYDKTLTWFISNINNKKRLDCTILYENTICGFIGLLDIEGGSKKAEYYICVDHNFSGKHIGVDASSILLEYAFKELSLEEVHLYTEEDNLKAQHLFEKLGFKRKTLLRNNLSCHGKNINRYLYVAYKNDGNMINAPIEKIKDQHNNIFMKREDLISFSFGGNKARKAFKFKDEVLKNKNDIIVTYGSSSSNHCRVIANMANAIGVKCIIMSPEESYKETYNSRIINMVGAEVKTVPLNQVKTAIEKLMKTLSKNHNPYFIPGGGHGILGTEAYIDCFNEIKKYEISNHIYFDYIFFATGTGTTHSGLVCGQYLNKDFNKKIIGISIARKVDKGKKVVIDSIKEYLNVEQDRFVNLVEFNDDYINGGYGSTSQEILNTVREVFCDNGIALNSTYTGKAYYGMQRYLKEKNISDKNILFINTGGLPLFFDDLIKEQL